VRYAEELNAPREDAYALAVLGIAQGALGREADALRHAQRAVELSAPVDGRRPSLAHYDYVHYYAQAAARFGRSDEALERLEWLLREPSGVHAHAELADPMWRPLDRTAGFQALVRRFLPSP
jgi:tetratricopeptide (TPR) repeat protein